MSTALLGNRLLAPAARSSSSRTHRSGRASVVRASYRPGFNFDAGKAFQQATEQFAQFQKQQAQQQSQSARRSTAGRTDAFRSRGQPVNWTWNFDPEQVNNFLRSIDRAFGGDGSDVPPVENMEEVASRLFFPVDVRESSTEYKYIIDLPGVPKADIKVN